jgi:acetolactate synthase-1/2/3 large subunit
MPDFLPADPSASATGTVLGGHLLADALRAAGTDTLFALCGGHILPLLDGCPAAGIAVVDHRHEGAATLAAEGYALATGRTGVAAITAGPGFANGLIGIADAGMWSVPLVVVGGHTGIPLTGRGAVQDLPQQALAAHVAKWSATCTRVDRLADMAATAMWVARNGKPGPAYLDVPQDVMAGLTDAPSGVAGHPGTPARAMGAPDDVDAAVAALRQASRPVIVAGGGCFWSGAAEPLRRFAERTGIPVSTNSCARGVLPDSHDLCLGTMVHGGGAVLTGDVVVVLGSEFNANMNLGQAPLFAEDASSQTVIQVDARAESLGGNRRPDLVVQGDISLVLDQLTEAWEGPVPDRTEWLGEAGALTDFVRSTWDDQIAAHQGARLHAGAVVRQVVATTRQRCGAGVTFVADGGDALAWSLAYMDAELPGRLLHTTTALGTLGVGLPFAIGAQVARPDERTVLFVGDGALGFAIAEIDTMVRFGLPVTVVVSNNYGWRDVAFEQDAWFGEGRHVASELADTRYDQVARGFGAHGEHVERMDELAPALERCLDLDGPAVINVQTDPDVISDLLRNLGTMGIQ